TLFNLGSRYTPSQRVLITNHLAWSGDRGKVNNRDNVRLLEEKYNEWTWHGDVSVVWSEKNRLDFGGLFRRPRQDGSTTQFVYSPALTQTLDISHGAGRQAGAYVQQSFAPLSGRVHITAGVRQDQHSEGRTQITSPYASVS